MVTVHVYVCRLVTRDAGLAPAAPLLREIAKVEPVTISELNNFVIPAVSEVTRLRCSLYLKESCFLL